MKQTNKLGVNLDDILGLINFGKKDCPCPKKKRKTKSEIETVGASKPVTFSNRGTRYSGTNTLNNIGNTIQNDTSRIRNDIARYELNNAVPWKNNQFVQANEPQNRFGNEILMIPQLKKPTKFNDNSFRRMGDENFEPVEDMDNISSVTPFTNESYEYDDDDEEEEYLDSYNYNNTQQYNASVEAPNNQNQRSSQVISYKRPDDQDNDEDQDEDQDDEISNPNEMSIPQYKQEEEMFEMIENPLTNRNKFVRNNDPNPLVTDDIRGRVQANTEKIEQKIKVSADKLGKQISGKLSSNKSGRLTDLNRDFMLQRLREYNTTANKADKVKTGGNPRIYEIEERYIKIFGMPKQEK